MPCNTRTHMHETVTLQYYPKKIAYKKMQKIINFTVHDTLKNDFLKGKKIEKGGSIKKKKQL